MRNFKDFTRAVAGIATSLKNINTVVEAIPVPGGGGIGEWTAPESPVSLTIGTPVTYDIPEGTTELLMLPYNSDNAVYGPPIIMPAAGFGSGPAEKFLFIAFGKTYERAMKISVASNVLTLTASSSGGFNVYIYTR